MYVEIITQQKDEIILRPFFEKHYSWADKISYIKNNYEKTMGLNYDKALKHIKMIDSMGFKFEIRGAGYARNGSEVLFNKDEFMGQFKGINQSIFYYSYHDRAGQAKNVDFKSSVQNSYCMRWDKWHHYLWDGTKILCCMSYNKQTPDNRELCKKCTSAGG
jgi:hypothetical protein